MSGRRDEEGWRRRWMADGASHSAHTSNERKLIMPELSEYWRIDRYRFEDRELFAFGTVAKYAAHPEAPDGKPWNAQVTMPDHDADGNYVGDAKLDEWYAGPAEARADVEAFVLANTDR